jgi:hypothetical protein
VGVVWPSGRYRGIFVRSFASNLCDGLGQFGWQRTCDGEVMEPAIRVAHREHELGGGQVAGEADDDTVD